MEDPNIKMLTEERQNTYMALLAAEKRLARAILLDAGRESIKAAMESTKEGVERLAHYDRLLEEYTAAKSRAVK